MIRAVFAYVESYIEVATRPDEGIVTARLP